MAKVGFFSLLILCGLGLVCSEYLLEQRIVRKKTRCPPDLTYDNLHKKCIDKGGNNNGFNCPETDSDEIQFYPHEDCNKYYMCWPGGSSLEKCDPGLHFNTELNVCDYPEAAHCQPPAVCPKENPKYAVLLPDPTDCAKYFVCDWGTPIPMECSKGLHFNPELKVCDYPDRAHCATP